MPKANNPKIIVNTSSIILYLLFILWNISVIKNKILANHGSPVNISKEVTPIHPSRSANNPNRPYAPLKQGSANEIK